jgi:DNA-directed RNA polymerase specialized sigma24 family protein
MKKGAGEWKRNHDLMLRVIRLKDVDGWTFGKIAEEIGYSRDRVRQMYRYWGRRLARLETMR